MISILTPCLNRAGLISETIQSVIDQAYPDAEHLIMDGGSTDGTLDLLERYPNLRVISETDDGLYDALNKGLRLAGGEIIGFLNSDDLYEPGTLACVAQTFLERPEIEALSGGTTIFSVAERGIRQRLAEFPGVASQELLYRATRGTPVFNGWFFRKKLLEALGGFDLRYRYVADRDLLIRMALQNTPYTTLDRLVYHYRMHPDSFTLSGQDSGEDDFMFEMRRLAEVYIRHKGLGTEAMRGFRDWHSQITIEQIRTAFHQRAYPRAARYALAGLRCNARWPLIFSRKLVERLPYILSRG